MLITKNFYYFFIRIFIILYNIKLNDKDRFISREPFFIVILNIILYN